MKKSFTKLFVLLGIFLLVLLFSALFLFQSIMPESEFELSAQSQQILVAAMLISGLMLMMIGQSFGRRQYIGTPASFQDIRFNVPFTINKIDIYDRDDNFSLCIVEPEYENGPEIPLIILNKKLVGIHEDDTVEIVTKRLVPRLVKIE